MTKLDEYNAALNEARKALSRAQRSATVKQTHLSQVHAQMALAWVQLVALLRQDALGEVRDA